MRTTSNVNPLIEVSLENIAKMHRIDRAYIFRYHLPHKTLFDNAYEWCAPGVTPYKDELQGLSSDVFRWLHNKVCEHKNIVIPNVRSMCESAAIEKSELERQGVHSWVVEPIVWSNTAVGFVGFDNIKNKRSSLDDKINDIGKFSKAVSSFIAKECHKQTKWLNSCFISYSHKDKGIANKIYEDLQENGVLCWYSMKKLEIGDNLIEKIDDAIRYRCNKLLLILSENSVNSDWVNYEINVALNEEIKQKRKIIFPIYVDNAIFDTSGLVTNLKDRLLGDFSKWNDSASYKNAFDALLRSLKNK